MSEKKEPMTVARLRELLNSPHSRRHDEDLVVVRRANRIVGPIAMSPIVSACFGSDWEKGRFILNSSDPLVVKSDKQALWDAAHDFLYLLSGDFRMYRGERRATKLGERAGELLEKFGLQRMHLGKPADRE